MRFLEVLLILSLCVPLATADFVDTAEACSRIGEYYAQGCSGLTAELLGQPWKPANSYRQGAYVGANSNYPGLSPGELVGFPGHVAVFVGFRGCNCKFVDVPGPARNARCLMNGYGTQALYKYYY